jgi:protein-S-isoprenylcysteine O-methyltransferase Ste14
MPVSAYIQAALVVLANAVALFAAAGTIEVASFAFLDPGLLRERMRPGGQRPPLALHLFALVLLLHWIVAGLDRGRFHWSDTVPAWLRVAGLIAVAAGYGLALWAMLVNRFFSSVVRIQSDRGQYVVTTGPYRWIRHPGYLAGIVIFVASGIALGSWLATAMLIVLSLPFALYRAITEDRVLQAELPGYRDYAARVRWRVLPGIW